MDNDVVAGRVDPTVLDEALLRHRPFQLEIVPVVDDRMLVHHAVFSERRSTLKRAEGQQERPEYIVVDGTFRIRSPDAPLAWRCCFSGQLECTENDEPRRERAVESPCPNPRHVAMRAGPVINERILGSKSIEARHPKLVLDDVRLVRVLSPIGQLRRCLPDEVKRLHAILPRLPIRQDAFERRRFCSRFRRRLFLRARRLPGETDECGEDEHRTRPKEEF
jgi:hypothetical protein